MPRPKYDRAFSMGAAVEFLTNANRFVNDFSDRFTEMEKAVIVLSAAIRELEVFYGLE
jgi:hypothetical protein